MVAERTPGSNPRLAGDAIRNFLNDLFAVVRESSPEENVTLSPANLAIALGMLEPGATGDASTQLREVFNISDPLEFHESVSALEQSLEARVLTEGQEGEDPGEVAVRISNALYLNAGWVGASKTLVGGLAVQFVLPDEGRFEEVASRLPEAFEARTTKWALLRLPKFETRTNTPSAVLRSGLTDLGLPGIFETGNLQDLVGNSDVGVTRILHETFVAFDETGVEAAASTVIIGANFSGPRFEPVDVVLGRSFLFRISDSETGATLFIGQVTNPNE